MNKSDQKKLHSPRSFASFFSCFSPGNRVSTLETEEPVVEVPRTHARRITSKGKRLFYIAVNQDRHTKARRKQVVLSQLVDLRSGSGCPSQLDTVKLSEDSL